MSVSPTQNPYDYRVRIEDGSIPLLPPEEEAAPLPPTTLEGRAAILERRTISAQNCCCIATLAMTAFVVLIFVISRLES